MRIRRTQKRAYDEFRQSWHKTALDLHEARDDSIIDIANTLAGKEGVDAANKYLDEESDLNSYHRPPKKQKTLSTAMPLRKRITARRPLKRRRLLRRKPLRARPIKRRRLGGMKRMIKQVARDSLEPKRSLFGPSASTGFQVPSELIQNFRIDNVDKHVTNPTSDDVASSYKGKEFFLKGVRIRGYLYNNSQYPTTVRMMIYKTKSYLKGELMTEILGGTYPLFHNPTTGESSQVATIPRLFKYNPKFDKASPFTMIKNKVFKLHATTRDQSQTPNDEIQTDPAGLGLDVVHFDVYVPLNRIQRQNVANLSSGIFDQQINHFVGFYSTSLVVDDETTQGPRCFFTGITYFKDN